MIRYFLVMPKSSRSNLVNKDSSTIQKSTGKDFFEYLQELQFSLSGESRQFKEVELFYI